MAISRDREDVQPVQQVVRIWHLPYVGVEAGRTLTKGQFKVPMVIVAHSLDKPSYY
jgi:hypothetical protein